MISISNFFLIPEQNNDSTIINMDPIHKKICIYNYVEFTIIVDEYNDINSLHLLINLHEFSTPHIQFFKALMNMPIIFQFMAELLQL